MTQDEFQIPVNNNHVSMNKSHPSSSGKNDEDSNSSNSNRRRMVVSQKVTAASKVKNVSIFVIIFHSLSN